MPTRPTTDAGKCIIVCTAIALYSTGHWIGGTVALAYLLVVNILVALS
jgi:hypothetical protein